MKIGIRFLVIGITVGLCSCEDFLDAKPDKSLVVPANLNEFQALMDNGHTMNVYSGISDIGTDDILLEDGAIDGLSNPIVEGNSYLWKADILEGFGFSEWSRNYTRILHSNVVLEQIDKISLTDAIRSEWSLAKGSALFYRAASFFDLLVIFGPAYQIQSASVDLGIPLRISPKVEFKIARSTMEESYSRIIRDLESAYGLLPERYQGYATRPSKQAATALLSRIYLNRGAYSQAEQYARESLSFGGELMDYNSLNPNDPFPIPQFNSEVVFHALMTSFSYIRKRTTYINPELLAVYQEGDLRKKIFFTDSGQPGKLSFKGNYSSGSRGFNGIALDEIYLTLAESLIRQGKLEEGIQVLNDLLVTRWDKDLFVPMSPDNEQEALELVLLERRKSLVFRGRRWEDLKRLNLDGRFQKSLEKTYSGNRYSLEPKSPRYVYPIPEDEIRQNPIQQNIR